VYQNISFEVKRMGKVALLAEKAWCMQKSGELVSGLTGIQLR
jgi:hypothetical protein